LIDVLTASWRGSYPGQHPSRQESWTLWGSAKARKISSSYSAASSKKILPFFWISPSSRRDFFEGMSSESDKWCLQGINWEQVIIWDRCVKTAIYKLLCLHAQKAEWRIQIWNKKFRTKGESWAWQVFFHWSFHTSYNTLLIL
jgi:hypothetical protein